MDGTLSLSMAICLVVFLLVACSVIKPPKISIPEDLKFIEIDFSVAPILGVLTLLATQTISPRDVYNGIIGNEFIKPWQIIILFFSLAYICVSMDSSGIYSFLSLKAVESSKGSGKRLFSAFFILSSLLTLFTSNDIVVLTLTPLIAYFTNYTETDPIPYLFVQFFASNIWSIALYIGNPTNIIVGEAFQIPFINYSFWMFLPAIFSGLTAWGIIYFVFKSRIPNQLAKIPQVNPRSVLRSKGSAIYGVVCLFGCLILLSLSSWLRIPIWIITLSFALLMMGKDIFNDFRNLGTKKEKESQESTPQLEELDNQEATLLKEEEGNMADSQHDEEPNSKEIIITWRTGDTATTLTKLPWKIVPFVVGMFIMVEGLNSTGLISIFAQLLAFQAPTAVLIFVMCFLSAMMCNLLNNQPMTILFTRILLHPNYMNAIPPHALKGSMYALIMGSNFGANFTIIGALAGIMWTSILADKGIKMTYLTFAKYGFMVMPAVVSVACIILSIEIAIAG